MKEFIYDNILFIVLSTFIIFIFILIKYQNLKTFNEKDPQKAWDKISSMVKTYSKSYRQQGNEFPKKIPLKIPKILEPYNIKYNPKTGGLIKPKNL